MRFMPAATAMAGLAPSTSCSKAALADSPGPQSASRSWCTVQTPGASGALPVFTSTASQCSCSAPAACAPVSAAREA